MPTITSSQVVFMKSSPRSPRRSPWMARVNYSDETSWVHFFALEDEAKTAVSMMLLAGPTVGEMLARAVKEPTLEKAVALMCVWECERVVKQAHEVLSGRVPRQPDGAGWDTCFEYLIRITMTAWNDEHP